MEKVTAGEIETLEYLRNIVETYEEVASIRMRRVKTSVLQNREFLEGISRIYYQVKYSYVREIEEEKKVIGAKLHIRRDKKKGPSSHACPS